MTNDNVFTVAAVQHAPVVHDLDAGLEKAVGLIADAAGQDARLVVFPEVWLQGYPYWASISTRDPAFGQYVGLLSANACEIPGPAIDRLASAARENQINVVISLHERAGGTLYNTQVYLAEDGTLLGAHRKLMPTVTERLVWGMGDGSDLAAYPTSAGKLSGLLCFEHQMAPARYFLAGQGVQVHASAWPGMPLLDAWIDASTRQLALENGCFVIVAREIMSEDRLPEGFPADPTGETERWIGHGGSAIIGPSGQYLVPPVFDEETIIKAEIDLRQIAPAKAFFDTVGHYARPDVFQLVFHGQPKPPVVTVVDED
ncbi:MAG: carbon-nitrogen hydrolase family protein [Chromatiales bacterium]|nr:MAG: carbon-nitrogen hydrolase family protein [Chromatiales bacterium]